MSVKLHPYLDDAGLTLTRIGDPGLALGGLDDDGYVISEKKTNLAERSFLPVKRECEKCHRVFFATKKKQCQCDDCMAAHRRALDRARRLKAKNYRRGRFRPRIFKNVCLNEGYDGFSNDSGCFGAAGKWLMDNHFPETQRYLDTSMGAGTCIYGHKILSFAYADLSIMPNFLAQENAELMADVTGNTYTVWCNSGTEATMRAMRIARAYTGRDKIATYVGAWHGTHDYGLIGLSAGIPAVISELMVQLSFNTADDFDRIKKRDLAAVMVEPIQASLPLDRSEYLRELRTVCTETGTVLIFDEMISGFRVGLKGAAGLYGISPDLTCYGKILGGGAPVGAVCGGQVMECIRSKNVRMGGTFSGNLGTMTYTNKVLKKLHQKELDYVHALTDQLQTKGANYYLLTHHGMARIIYTAKPVYTIADRDRLELPKTRHDPIRARALQAGVYLNPNNCIYLSLLHTKEDVEKILETLDAVTK